jgi:MinD-like ATPase involved in chromosome partitioning or flagellar assembly
VRYGGRVLLADLARRADQAMLHDAGELGPGVQELVEAHRLGHPEPAETRSYTFDVPSRGYRLLLGLRRPEAWAALRPRATDAAVDALRRAFQLVVADVTGDLEGEADGGSLDVEERNHLARTCIAQADAVVVVGAPGLKGVHSLARLVRQIGDGGAGPRLVAVVNRAPRHPRTRAEIATALARMTGGAGAMAAPVWVPERRVDDALRNGTPLPRPVVDPVTAAVQALLQRTSIAAQGRSEPQRVAPGSLGVGADGS